MALERSLHAAASQFEARVEELAARIVSREREEIRELTDLEAPEIWEVNRRIVVGSRRAQAVHLRRGSQLPVSCPEPDREAARFGAGGGITLGSVLQAYRIGHALAWDAWLDVVENLDVPESERRDCLKTISRFVVAYDDQLMNLVTEEFERELESARASPEKQRLKHVRDLLDGSAESLNGLDYDLGLEHLGVIAWGPDAEATLRTLASYLDRRLIWAPAEDDLLMAWLGSSSPLDARVLGPLREFNPNGSRLALGTPARGLEGFRRTHREAGEAHVVAKRRPQPLTRYEDVALEAFALRDENAARGFVAHALHELGDLNGRTEALHDTLRAYFGAGQNAASAAAALGVHKHTVARRIQSIEERLGCPINARRAELELALRLEPLLR